MPGAFAAMGFAVVLVCLWYLPSLLSALNLFRTTESPIHGNLEDSTTEGSAGSSWQLTDAWGAMFGLKIHIYYLPVVIVVGTVGNVLSLLVLGRLKKLKISCHVYMRVLACTDLGMLLVAAEYYARSIQVVYISKFNLNTVVLPPLECKVSNWMFQTFSLSGVLVILTMTVDRLIGVRFPLKSLSLCSVSRAQKISLSIPCLCLVYTFPFFLYTDFVGPTCTSLAVKNSFTVAYSWITIALNSIIPFSSILTMNVLIIVTILRRHDQKLEEVEDRVSNSQLKRSQQDKQLVVQLLLVSFTLLLLTSPLYIRFIVYQYLDETVTVKAMSDFHIAFHVTNKIFYTNFGINFILYCVGGSQFRKTLRELFVKSSPRKHSKSAGTRPTKFSQSETK